MNKHQLSERYSLYLKFLLHSVCAVESITLQLSLMLYLELILLSCTSSVLVVNFNSRWSFCQRLSLIEVTFWWWKSVMNYCNNLAYILEQKCLYRLWWNSLPQTFVFTWKHTKHSKWWKFCGGVTVKRKLVHFYWAPCRIVDFICVLLYHVACQFSEQTDVIMLCKVSFLAVCLTQVCCW